MPGIAFKNAPAKNASKVKAPVPIPSKNIMTMPQMILPPAIEVSMQRYKDSKHFFLAF